MPDSIRSLHVIFTLVSIGVLVGLGWALAHIVITWPAGRVAQVAAIVCLLIIVIAWIV